MKKLLSTVVIFCMLVSLSQVAFAAVATSAVTYSNGEWTGTKSIEQLGLDASYSYGNKFTSNDVEPSAYTVEYEDDCILIKGGTTGAKELSGVTKNIGAVNVGDTVIVKTGFYSGDNTVQTDIGFGTAIRLIDSSKSNASYALAVGKWKDSGSGFGVAMNWNASVTCNDFGEGAVILNRADGATLDADTWYDLTLMIERTSEGEATIIATLEWDIPSGISDDDYLASFSKKDDALVVLNGKASITKSGTTTKPNIDSIELLQSTAGSGYKSSSSKFSKVFAYSGDVEIPEIGLLNVTNKNSIVLEEGNTLNPKEELLTFNFSDDVYIRKPHLTLTNKNSGVSKRIDNENIEKIDSKTIKATLKGLDENAEYDLVIVGVYNNIYGNKIDITKAVKTRSNKTADNPVTAVVAEPLKTATDVTYSFTITNEAMVEKKIAAFIVQYSENGKIKKIEERIIDIGANSAVGGSDTELSLTYKEPANGEKIRLILLDSLSFDNGLEFHPILEMDSQNSTFDIVISEQEG